MKWNFLGVEPDFDYFKPIDFCGDWLNVIMNLSEKSKREELKTYDTPFKVTISVIIVILIIFISIIFSIIAMIIYYGTFPIRFLVDIICALYAKFSEIFY